MIPIFILSLLGIIVSAQPSLKYWSIIIHEKTFSIKEFIGCSVFQATFLASTSYYVFWMLSLNKLHYTIIPILAWAQLSFFTVLNVIVTAVCLISIPFKKFDQIVNRKIYKKGIHIKCGFLHSAAQFVSPFFDANFNISFLSGRFQKTVIFITYIVSGIISCSPTANYFITNEIKKGASDSIITMLRNEVSLYSNIFVVGTIPLALGIFFKKSQTSPRKHIPLHKNENPKHYK